MPTFYFKKLVRDAIPALHVDAGHDIDGSTVSGLELKKALKAKMYEEISELPVREAVDDEVMGELVDMQQVLDDLKASYGVTSDQVAAVQTEKFERKGGFSGGSYIESVTMPDDDRWAAYCREQPYKYHEEQFPTIETGVYRHNKKGDHYEVLGVSLHTETNEPVVVYRPMYDSPYQLFARPMGMFTETITIDGKQVPRFEKIGSKAEG